MRIKKKVKHPPLLGERILKWVLPPEESHSLSGDYLELYAGQTAIRGKLRADIWYWKQILRTLWTAATIALYWRAAMLRSYLKIGTRNILRTRVFSLINITGLAIGMAGTLMIMVYVANEMNYENFHTNRKRIYRVSIEFGKTNSRMHMAGIMSPMAPALISEVPEVENAVRFYKDEKAKTSYQDKEYWEYSLFFADPTVFDVFTFPLISGSSRDALSEPYTAVITEETARKYFGEENPIGKTLLYNSDHPIKVTGILKSIPANTHLKCEILVSYSTLDSLGRTPDQPWNIFGDTYTYLLLKQNTSLDGVLAAVNRILRANTSKQFADMLSFELLGLSDIHMKSKAIFDLAPKGNLSYVYVFFSVAILVLLIACFNFINLSTARSLKRIKEVGVRKVMGAGQSQIVRQFLGESMLLTMIAVSASLLIFQILYPVFNGFLENSLSASQQDFRYLLGLVPLVVIVVGVLAGSYPAFFLSRSRPVNALAKRSHLTSGRSLLRRILVVVQFAMAIILMVGTTVILTQLDFMKNSNLGFSKQNVVLAQFEPRNPNFAGKYPVLFERFKQIPDVINVAGAYTVPGRMSKFTISVQRNTEKEVQKFTMQAIPVDYEYLETMGTELVAGRSFSREIAGDAETAVLLNEAAVKTLQLENPVGEMLSIPGSGGSREATVIGVVKDFHIYSLKQEIEPLVLQIDSRHFFTVAVRIRPENIPSTIESLQAAWTDLFPGTPFEYVFLDDSYNRLYISEEKIGHLLTVFSGLAVFVACLGLFGLASYLTEQRQKEIGIRKVLGADVTGILRLLSKDFSRNVLAANLAAWPAAYLISRRWLQDYAYRISIGWWIFALAAAAVLGIAMLTVIFQSLRAARANPVDSLRYE